MNNPDRLPDTFANTFEGILELTAFLRSPEGCPWDREQTHQSLKGGLIEECFELAEALDGSDPEALAEELGDVSVNLAYHLLIAGETGEFTPDTVFRGLKDKLVRRHPHVFGDAQVSDSRGVKQQWEAIKRAERESTQKSLLDGVPKSMPALSYAQSVQERAARVGFDWEDFDGVLAKVNEEVAELSEAQTPEHREAELGDLLFSLVNVGRWMGVDVEGALRGSNVRFHHRFAEMERTAEVRGESLADMSLDEKEILWQQAKAALD